MAEDHALVCVCCDIQNADGVNVDVNRLVANYYFSGIVRTVVDEHLHVANVQPILKINYELWFENLLLVESEHVESEGARHSISTNEEISSLWFKFNVLDEANIE